MAKILFVNVPYTGHVNPTLGLVKALLKSGNEISYVNAPEWRKKIEDLGAEFIEYINYPTKLSNIEKDHRVQMAAYTTALMVAKNYDLIIYEMMVYLGNTLAKQVNVPAIRVFSMFAYNDIVLKNVVFKSPSWFYFRYKITRKIYSNITVRNILMQEEDVWYEIAGNVPDINIVCTTRDFQAYQNSFDSRYYFVGAMVDKSNNKEGMIDFHDFDNPIVYFSMGTILKKKSLVKKCIRAFRGKKVDVIISLGQSVELSKMKVNAENIHLFQHVDQLDVLKHAAVFITHAGMNSVNESIYHEVPMVAIPMCTDAFANAERVRELQIGVKLSKYFVTAGRLRRSTMRVLADAKMRKNIHSIKIKSEEAGGIQKAVEIIQGYLNK